MPEKQGFYKYVQGQGAARMSISSLSSCRWRRGGSASLGSKVGSMRPELSGWAQSIGVRCGECMRMVPLLVMTCSYEKSSI